MTDPKAATAHAVRVEEMRTALSALGPTTARDALVSCGARVDWGEEMAIEAVVYLAEQVAKIGCDGHFYMLTQDGIDWIIRRMIRLDCPDATVWRHYDRAKSVVALRAIDTHIGAGATYDRC